MSLSLQEHLVSPDPDALVEARLLRKYHSTLAERLWLHLTEPESNEREFFERTPTLWLHPRGCWAAQILATAPDLFSKVRAQVWRDLHASRTSPPGLEVLTGNYEDPWCSTARGYLEDYDRFLGKTSTIQMADLSERLIQDRVSEASRLIADFWPEAYAEQQLMLRTIVAVRGGGYMYGSFQNMVGSIFAAQNSLQTVESVVEMLLHEIGHQSLFVHCAFHELVTNGGTLVSHPLRADPRPIGGTVHAAHVIGRLAAGFTRWCETGSAPSEAHVRRNELAGHLDVTLNTLEKHARWTDSGAAYFHNLLSSCAPYRFSDAVGTSQ